MPGLARRRVAVHQQRDGGEDEGDAGDVVERLAGLELHQATASRARPRRRSAPAAPRPYGRPMHQAASSATASQPRLSIGETMSRSKNRIGDRVDDLGVRRVERGQEDRVEEVDVAEVAGLHEPRRERHVVPEAVGAVHARGERAEGRAPSTRRRARHRRSTATAFASPHDRRRRCGRRWPAGRRRAARDQPGADADDDHGAEHGALLEPPKVPSASETQISAATPSTTSASRAGAPDQPGKQQAPAPGGRRRRAPRARAPARARRPGRRRPSACARSPAP